MKIAIVAAMDKELEILKEALENRKDIVIDNTSAYKGNIGIHDIICLKCGIGKVNSAIRTYKMLVDHHPDLVINSGVAGSGDEKMQIGDLLFATEVAYHDAWCGPGTEYGAADGFPQRIPTSNKLVEVIKNCNIENLHTGLICSGDIFMTTSEQLANVKAVYPDCLCVDMESTSIGQVCFSMNIPFGILRAVSDRPGGGDNISEYQNFWQDTPVKLANTLKTIINSI